MSFLMQARSTATGLLVAWVSSTPDFTGTGFPGPGMPEYVAVSAVVSEATGDGGVTAPLSPNDNGKFPQAQSGDLTYITATQLTADLNIFTSSLKGLTPASGGGTTNYLRADGSWDVPVNLPISGGDDNKVALGLSGDLAFAANLRVGSSGDSLLFNGTATTGASLNFTSSGTLARGRNTAGTGNVDLLIWGSAADRLWIGDSSGLAGANLLLKTGGDFSINVNGTPEYTFDATALTMNANNLLMGGGFIQFSGNAANQGEIRFSPSAGTHGIWWRNNANTADISGIFSGTDDVLYLGDSTNSVGMNLRVKTGGGFNLLVNSVTEYVFSGTTADFKDNVLQFGTNPAQSGLIRFAHNNTLLTGRNSTNSTDVIILNWGSLADRLILGDSVSLALLQLQAKTAGSGLDVRFGSQVSWNFNENRLFVLNTAAAPSSDPTGGGYFYSEAGAGKWRGSSGTVTTFGPAEPHCPRCDRDFAHEWESKKYGKLSVCMSCLVDALEAAGISANDFVIERKVA